MYSCTLLVLYHIHQLHKDCYLRQLTPHRQLVYICHCIHSFSHSFSTFPNFTSSILTFMLNPFFWPFPLTGSHHLCISPTPVSTHPPSQACPSFYHLLFCLPNTLPLSVSSSPSLLFAQKIILFISLTQNFTRKRSVNLDTLIETLLLDFPGFTCSHSFMDNIHGSWTFLLPLLFSPAPSSPSSHVFSSTHCHPTLFPVTATPLWHNYLQLHSKPFSNTLTSFWVFLCSINAHQGTIATFAASNEPLWMHSFTLLQIFASPSILPSSSSNATASLVLVNFGGWYFTARKGCLLPSGSYPPNFRWTCPQSTQGMKLVVHQMSQIFSGKSHVIHTHAHTRTLSLFLCCAGRQPMLPRTVTHQLQVGWQTPTSEIPSFTPPSHPLLTPAAIPQGAPAKLSGQDHQASCPNSYTFYNFCHTPVSHSLIHTSPFPTPSTLFCQFLESSLPTHKRNPLCLDLGFYWQETFTNLIVPP